MVLIQTTQPRFGSFVLFVFFTLTGAQEAASDPQIAAAAAAASEVQLPRPAALSYQANLAIAVAGVRAISSDAALGADSIDGAASAATTITVNRVNVTSGLVRLLQAAKLYRARSWGPKGPRQHPHLLRHRDIHRALYMGDQERIRSFVRRMAEGQNVTIALLGGSVSKGMGAVLGEPSFEQWLNLWLAAVLPAPGRPAAAAAGELGAVQEEAWWSRGAFTAVAAGNGSSSVRVVNAACPATSSAYMNLCLREYLRDTDVDFILVDYSINDLPDPRPLMINEPRKSFEQLLRKLLRLPKRPAVVLFNMYRWQSEYTVDGIDTRHPSDTLYFTNAEAQFYEFATYYGIPMISLKAAVYHQMAAGVRGFQVNTMRYLTRSNQTADPEALFYEDAVHPSGLTGHRVISELVVGLLLNVARGLVMRPWRPSEEEQIVAPLPNHMVPGNFDTQLDKCLMGDNLRAAAVDIDGFEWVNEGRNLVAPKWGYTAYMPNATIVFPITGSAVGAGGADATAVQSPAGNGNATLLVILAYLRSYTDMGVAAVSCEGDCICGEEAIKAAEDAPKGTLVDAGNGSSNNKVVMRLDGMWQQHTSQLQLGCFPLRLTEPAAAGVAAAAGCRVRVRVDDAGRKYAINKVKLGGLIVSHTAPEIARGLCHENLEATERAAGYRER